MREREHKMAAKLYDIPATALSDRIKGRIREDAKYSRTTEEKEREIVDTCILFAGCRFGVGEVEAVLKLYIEDALWKLYTGEKVTPWTSLAKTVQARAPSDTVVSHWFNEILLPN